MYTKTSKHILGTLAEAVSSLIIIISDAEINSALIPDLSQLGKVVVSQIQNLLEISKKIISQPSADSQLKQDMKNATEQGIFHLIQSRKLPNYYSCLQQNQGIFQLLQLELNHF